MYSIKQAVEIADINIRSLTRFCFLVCCLCMTCCVNGANVPPQINLNLPESFRGDIFILEDQVNGQNWKHGSISVNRKGVAFVSDLMGLSKAAPNKFIATYPNGRALQNSVLRTGEEISLWPVTYVEQLTLYFVVGTFREKTRLENQKMRANWRDIVAAMRSGK